MATTHIPPEQVLLNNIIRHISVAFDVELIENELRIELDEEKLLCIATNIVNSLPEVIKDYTGKENKVNVSKVHIRIGDYNLKANWETEIKTVVNQIGFKRKSND